MWFPVIDIVKQVPEDHSIQDQFISLLVQVSKMPRPASRSDIEGYEREYHRSFWDTLPELKGFLFEQWRYMGCWERSPSQQALADDPSFKPFCHRYTTDEWTSINAFIAKCYVKPQLHFKKLHLTPVRVLNEALEMRRRPDGMEDNLPAAAAWILHAGRWLFDSEDQSEVVQLYRGRRGVFCMTDRTE